MTHSPGIGKNTIYEMFEQVLMNGTNTKHPQSTNQ